MINKYQKNNRGSRFVKLYSASSKRSPEYSKGYAILFTVVIVGIISMITIGLSNSAYKQTILSAVARDSTTAFYQADIGSECAMYVDAKFINNDPVMNSNEAGWTCGGKLVTFGLPENSTVNGVEQDIYTLDMGQEGISSRKCFRIEIIKKFPEVPVSSVETEIYSKGYNICNTNNMRTVERALKVTY